MCKLSLHHLEPEIQPILYALDLNSLSLKILPSLTVVFLVRAYNHFLEVMFLNHEMNIDCTIVLSIVLLLNGPVQGDCIGKV